MADDHSAKPQNDDDIGLFEEMEQNFNRVVRELINDRSLDKFREEYEKLHDALTQSHEHNNTLIEKCRTLNQDILKNANKISTVLTMSQNDQKTIANLRSEFENAWKMVEQSQARETKSKDVIISLREELQNLTTLVSKSSEIAAEEEASIKSAKQAIDLLDGEISKNAATHDEILSQFNEHQAIVSELTPQNKAMHDEFDQMTTEREEIRKRRKANRKEMNDAYQGMDDTRAIIAQIREKITELDNQKAEQKEKLRELNRRLRLDLGEIEDIKEDIEKIHKKIHKKLIERDIARKATSKTQIKLDKKREEVEIQEAKNQKFIDELEKVSEELEISKEDLAYDKQRRDEVAKEKREMINRMNKLRDELYLAQSTIAAKELAIRNTHEQIELRNKEKREFENQKQVEKMRTQVAEHQVEMTTRECSSARVFSQKQKNTADNLDIDRQYYAGKLIINENNYYQVFEDIAGIQEELDKCTIQLGEIQDEITRQGYLCDAMRGERDMLSRSLNDWRISNEKYSSENKSLEMFVNQLKNSVKQQDQKVVDLHLESQLLKKYVKQLEADNNKLKEELLELEKKNMLSKQEIEKNLVIENEAYVDIDAQKRKLKALNSMQAYFGATMAKRQDECDLLNEKCRLIGSEMRICEKHYIDKVAEIEQLKENLMQVIHHQHELLELLRRRDAARSEMLRLEKELNTARSQNKALEDEAEFPRNVHRWTLMEQTDPEQFQLIMLREDLLQSIWNRLNQFSKLRNRSENLKEQYDKQNKKLMISYAGSYQEDMQSTKEALRRKTIQLNNLAKKLDEKKPKMRDEREKCNSVRSLIRERQIEVYDLKHRESELLMSSMDKVFEVKAPTISGEDRARGRFIGGGFGVGAAQMTTVIPKIDLGRAKSDRGNYGSTRSNAPRAIVMPGSARRIKRPGKVYMTQNRTRTIQSARIPVDEF
ncbi:coiled-coil domain containing 147 [Tritrichomonas foetus]|uniref:Coiled-coil domain containing 147 n=1 Tax=Tritrichomonas foetus TaxID=1144522 RepID=A0A1J4KL71_9EUKA|nr:coiled-coil domain containing 147 [Tritrichomonas foetus]|eukprot:OHT10532.1 coiled-coil domain containing 147 [Tritrichomonas foetus]